MNKINDKSNKVNRTNFSRLLLAWYDLKARKLPWRITPELSKKGIKKDPYNVWISEIMLQQTNVKTVKNYYLNFINRWPDIFKLNEAEEDDILRSWSGLGYYRRALNLKKCARIICEKHNGNFPDNEKELLNLPGIGKYTAAAISSIAFDKSAIVVDGNIERLIARIFEIKENLKENNLVIYKSLETVYPKKRYGDFAQAMMDLGSLICKPINPVCNLCPVIKNCIAYKNNTFDLIPVKKKRPRKVMRKGYIFIGITLKNEIILFKRPKNGLLGGTTCPPTSDWIEGNFPSLNPPYNGNWRTLDESIFHTFTHFNLELKIMIANIKIPPKNAYLEPLNPNLLSSFPTVIRKCLNLALENYFN